MAKKQAEKPPAFQFYPKDWLSDINVISMSDAERGVYINLLCVDWLQGGIEKSRFANMIAHLPEGTSVNGCFVSHPKRANFLTNPRLQKERNKQENRRRQASDAGKRSGKARRLKELAKGTTVAPPLPFRSNETRTKSNSSSSSSSSSSLDKNIYRRGKKTFDPADFKKFLDWVYLKPDEIPPLEAYYRSKGLGPEDLHEAVAALDRWYSNNPEKRTTRTCDAKALRGWPLNEALERKRRLLAVDRQKQITLNRS